MSAEGDALKTAASELADLVLDPPDSPVPPITPEALASFNELFRDPERTFRDAVAAYVDAVEATLADHESRIAALEP